MEKPVKGILKFFFILILTLFTNCREEEIVIVYSEIETVGTSAITSTSARVEGHIKELTETTHSEYGVCWSTAADPTVYDAKLLSEGAADTGSFSVVITELEPSTTYHVRAFVIDNKKYVYGSGLHFTTSAAVLPEVSTRSVSGITSAYAVSGGNVSEEGDKPVIARGVCYDTASAPTIEKNLTLDGWGTGSYTSQLNNLKPSKKYYARAYAISEFGVAYGNQVSFTTDESPFLFFEDFDDNSTGWSENTDEYGSSEVTDGEYVYSFHREGYLRRTWMNFPDFPDMANSKDFEIEASIKNLYHQPLMPVDAVMIVALLWDCGGSSFRYFAVKKQVARSRITTYYYKIGSYDGSYTTWQDYTQFTGSTYNTLSIRKGNGYYYFFINDEQVYKHSYTSINEEGIGFFIQDAEMHADYLSIEQWGDKKSMTLDLLQLFPEPEGQQDMIRSPENR